MRLLRQVIAKLQARGGARMKRRFRAPQAVEKYLQLKLLSLSGSGFTLTRSALFPVLDAVDESIRQRRVGPKA